MSENTERPHPLVVGSTSATRRLPSLEPTSRWLGSASRAPVLDTTSRLSGLALPS